ncbi:guanine nucleotide exchange factor subunit RIC1-like isoform X1 [Ruditapes philippinarum]|uniref:guanine nucleotide exchange factor subunit RIC1-like isoform X1 n=1 Tax=Ruditapes philippinarum TaxID=129788 RepID=UPI00295B0C89|nr:guanine nucleotide exchange factor subunit RIC1-like isoform X1 [Ruditapes philippinarum]
MYFPVGWPKYIKQPCSDLREPCHIISSCDRMLFAIVSEEEISIWYCKPAVQIVSYTQSEKSLEKYGRYCKAEWKPDSAALAVITSNAYIILFKVDLDISVPNHHCLYVTAETSSRAHNYLEGNGLVDCNSVPAIKLTLQKHVKLSASITCCLSIREELAVATEDGFLTRIHWSGTENTKASVCLKDLSVAADMLQSRGNKLTLEDGHVVQMEYSPIIGGYCLVLSSGKAMLMMSLSARGNDSNSSGVWATNMTDAVCQTVNHRYRLIAYGCADSHGVIYSINEVEGLLESTHKLQVSCKNFPILSKTVGAVTCMRWTPDGTALAMAWKKGGFALWSVFGSLLACTVGGDYRFDKQISECNDCSFTKDYLRLFPPSVKSMEWGLEGYQLWMIGSQCNEGDENGQYATVDHTDIIQLQFAKSSLTVNPCMANHEHVFLQGEDKLYLNTGDITSKSSQYGGCESHILVGSKQWQIIPISHSYLASNWPIRYACVDKAGQCVAVAGKTGLAHYALFNRKWKLFGNETQERDMVVSGGVTWWKDFICVACYNIIGHRDEIRCYPRESKLDNTFANIQKVPSQVLLINIFKDTLLVFCVDSHVMIFNLERTNTQSTPSVEISKIQEVGLSNYIPHPVCVTGIVFTSLKIDIAPLVASQRPVQSAKDSESLLLNVAGKLLVFQRDRTGPQIKQKEKSPQKAKPLPFSSPSVVATNVENLWTTSRSVTGKLQLTEALWLSCGCHGMKVWLPLLPKNDGQAHNFMSKRIMLPFRVDIYPLAVLFEEAVILGVASDASMLRYNSTSSFCHPSRHLHDLPYCSIERTSQVYLHHILKQLLKRNLGVQALDLARCCTELSYFSHVLELLLHEVLEAEATSKEPIPDPLLPRVVAFIQEFPEYLQTFVQCARKTEVALWPHLFTTVGNPKDLFEECLISARLETAASYLIILQNLEKPIASRQHATLLLDSAIEDRQWELAQDLVRFLKAIDPNDADVSPPLVFNQGKVQSCSYIGSPAMPREECDFTFSSVSNVSRIRSSSVTAESAVREASKEKVKLTHTKSDNQMISKRPSPRPVQPNSTADQVYIDTILFRHARKLLSSNRLQDLGSFSANIRDFQLVAWLKKERLRSGKVEDFVSALRDIHHQFEWPLPVLSLSAFQQLKSKAYSSTSLASLSLLDDDTHNGSYTGQNNTLVPQVVDNEGKGRPLPKNASFVSTEMSDEIVLKPQLSKADDSSLATLEVSDTSSLFGDFEFLADSSSSLDSLSPELELLSQEIISKGPGQSELELRYLFQVMLEGGCLEWALIISIVLRDSSSVIRTINTASMTDTPLETVARMREGLSYLELWSDTECVGYKPFLHAIRSQIQVLTKIAEQAPPTLKLNADIDSAPATVEEGNLSPGTMSIHEGQGEVDSPPVQEPHKQNECAVS